MGIRAHPRPEAGPGAGRTRTLKLRDKLFLSYGSLSVVILLAAAWVIDRQVVAEARRQVQEEMKTSLPLYEAVWEEQAGRLSALGMAMAGSPIAKTIFGDPRAARDTETIRQMLSDFGQLLSHDVDLVVIADGGGHVVFVEDRGPGKTEVRELPSARIVAETQKPAESFELVDGRLFHLALAPVLSHSAERRTRQHPRGAGRGFRTGPPHGGGTQAARPQRRRLFRGSPSLFVFAPRRGGEHGRPDPRRWDARQTEPTEILLGGEGHLAFARPLASLDRRFEGRVVVLHSLGAAVKLFHAISGRLVLVGSASIALVLLISYYLARRITRPIEALALGAREFGRGNYEHPIGTSPGGEIGQLAAAFEQMRRSVREGQAVLLRAERLTAVGRMASGIIHDLRSPLAAISTAAELFATRELPAENRQMLAENQLKAARRMATMLRDLLEFARGRYALNLERHELAPLIQAVARETVSSASTPGLAVDIQVPPGIYVRVDRERLRRLFVNLLVNSVQAMPGGGTITIRAASTGRSVRINVADTGAGIPSQLRDRLFEPFVSHGKEGGTGLGLAVASSIAEGHGGSLTLASAVGQPADFCVELPLAPEEQP